MHPALEALRPDLGAQHCFLQLSLLLLKLAVWLCRYESIIATLCENLESLDEPEAKASMIWIIGEYADRIENADELLESFLEAFPEETAAVQLQLVTATVKLFLKRPTERVQQMIQLVLTFATQVCLVSKTRDGPWLLLHAAAVVYGHREAVPEATHRAHAANAPARAEICYPGAAWLAASASSIFRGGSALLP